jgi:PE family
MSFVTALPAALASAAGELQSIGAAVATGNMAAAGPTTAVAPAAADQVSALTAAHFAAQAVLYQELAAQATAIHEQFVTTLATSAGSYLAAEIANAATVR